MNNILEEMIKNVVKESSKQIAGKLITMSDLSIAQIAEITELSEKDVKTIANQNNTVLGMASGDSRK